MATLNVGNASQLRDALGSASSGDDIVLADGNYGSLNLNQSFSSEVSITAASESGAVFDDLEVRGSNLTFDGIQVNGTLSLQGVNSVTVENSRLAGFSEVDSSSNVRFEGNDIGGGQHGLFIESSNNFTVVDNRLHDVSTDLLRVMGNSYEGVIENNDFDDVLPQKFSDGTYTHADFIQMFGRDNGTPHDLTIRGNKFFDDPETGDSGNLWGQGIFISDPGAGAYSNIVIDQNVMSIGSPNTIFILDHNGGNGIEVTNNTLLPWPDGSGGTIRTEGSAGGVTIDGNVIGGLSNNGGANVGDNYTYSKNSGDANFYGNLLSGDGDVWQDFLPQDGSAVDFGSGYGALDLLREFQNGGSGTSDDDSGSDTGGTDSGTDGTDSTGGTDSGEDDSSGSDSTDGGTSDSDTSDDDGTDGTSTDREGIVYAMSGAADISGAGSVEESAPTEAMDVSEGTLRFSFNADSLGGGRSGLVSRDAYGNGDHFTSFVENGVLNVRFQSSEGEVYLTADGIEAGTDHQVTTSFGSDGVALYLDGEMVDSSDFSYEMSGNGEFLQVGANGWASQSGDAGYTDVFDGTISDVYLADSAMSEDDFDALLNSSADTGSDAEAPESDASSEEGSDDTSGGGDTNGGTDTETGGALNGNLVYYNEGAEVSSASDVTEVDPGDELALSEGTVRFTFQADSIGGREGLVSRDAYGNGDHFTSFIEGDDLVVRFQNADDQVRLTTQVEAGTSYDVQASFGNGEVSLRVNDETVDSAQFDSSWEDNSNVLQIGANGWASEAGETGFTDVFDGTISKVAIFDTANADGSLRAYAADSVTTAEDSFDFTASGTTASEDLLALLEGSIAQESGGEQVTSDSVDALFEAAEDAGVELPDDFDQQLLQSDLAFA